MGKSIILLLASLLFINNLYGQTNTDQIISEYLNLVSLGRVSEVKMKLPDLLAEYPNDPGVRLLHAVVIEDANKAMDIYLLITQNYPTSPWADDAFWRIIQYYAITGDVEKANVELNNFRKRYPTSVFLGPATDVVKSAERIKKTKLTFNDTPPQLEETENIAPVRQDIKEIYTNPSKENNPTEVVEPQKKDLIEEDIANTEEVKFGLQVGVYRDKQAAENEKDKFVQKRIRTNIVERTINDEKMYSVVVGDYSSKERAEKAKKIVEKECQCTPIVIQK